MSRRSSSRRILNVKRMFVFLFLITISCYAQLFQPSISRFNYNAGTGGTNVTTAAWVTAVASLPAAASEINVTDTSGQTLLLGRFASGCATQISQILIPQGGQGQAPYAFQAGECVKLKSLSATANAGENDITFFP